MRDVNAEGGGDTSEDTKEEEPGSAIDTEEGSRREERPRGES